MPHKPYTKDESFLVVLYDMASSTGDPEAPFDRYLVGQKALITAKGVEAISKLLLRANFIKKSGENEVYLTPHGIKLVNQLLLQ